MQLFPVQYTCTTVTKSKEALVHGARTQIFTCVELYCIHAIPFVPGLVTAYVTRRPMAQHRALSRSCNDPVVNVCSCSLSLGLIVSGRTRSLCP